MQALIYCVNQRKLSSYKKVHEESAWIFSLSLVNMMVTVTKKLHSMSFSDWMIEFKSYFISTL